MKITFVIWALAAAGSERVLSLLANTWASRGWHVSILTLDKGIDEPFYALDRAVVWQPLNVARHSCGFFEAVCGNFRALRALRKALRWDTPDVVVSFIDRTNISTLLASRGLGIPVVVSERTDPSRRNLEAAWECLRQLTYPWATQVVVQAESVKDWLEQKYGVKPVLISNPVVLPLPIQKPSPADQHIAGRKHLVCSVGRLSRVKGHDLLIAAFARLAGKYKDWSLVIWGEGPERAALEEQILEAGLAGKAHLPGITRDPFGRLREAALFVLPSRAEGFPNALTEAMACGLAVISTQCGGAIRDIVQHGKNGLLVPAEDSNALAEAMDQLMGDSRQRERLSARAPEVLQRFSMEHVLSRWDEVIVSALHPKADRIPGWPK